MQLGYIVSQRGIEPKPEKVTSSSGWARFETLRLRVKSLSCGVNLDVVNILNTHVYV
jgi:hypothetical protein